MPAAHSNTVLVVEDNEDHALLVRFAVERADASLDVRHVPDGEAALAYLRGDPPFADREAHPMPGLVILDLLLPGMGGVDVLEEAAGDLHLTAAPIVVLTSSMNPGDRGRALAAGAADYHTKPPDVASLGETVRDILRRWLR